MISGTDILGILVGEVVRKILLFLKKKKQKDFYNIDRWSRNSGPGGNWIEVFWFFFSKKNILAYRLSSLAISSMPPRVSGNMRFSITLRSMLIDMAWSQACFGRGLIQANCGNAT